MTDAPEYWYRFETANYSLGTDEFGDTLQGKGNLRIYLVEFRVAKHTPKGVRLDTGRFVNREHTKRYACPTIQEARESFVARKQRYLRILTSQMEDAKLALIAIKRNPVSTDITIPPYYRWALLHDND